MFTRHYIYSLVQSYLSIGVVIMPDSLDAVDIVPDSLPEVVSVNVLLFSTPGQGQG